MGIYSEEEFDSLLVPPVQFPRQGKVGVPAQGDLPGIGATNLIARSIRGTQPSWLTTLPGTVDQVQHFVGGWPGRPPAGHNPNAFVEKSHPGFAFPESWRNRAVGVDQGLCQKALGLLLLNPLPHRVGNLHEMGLRQEIIAPIPPQLTALAFSAIKSRFLKVSRARFFVIHPSKVSI